ncbi:hypothetical protein WJX77_010944 [Trebouxia sp. C0004]
MNDPLANQNALFNQYESEYCSKSTDISRKVQALSSFSADVRRLRTKEIEAELKEADQILRRMDMEARSFSQEKSQQLMRKVKEYKADLKKITEDSRQAQGAASGGAAARAELGLADNYYDTSAGQRERMLKTTEKLDKTSDRISQGRAQLAETEVTGAQILEQLAAQRQQITHAQATELGVSILQDLHRQRETITHAQDTLHGADDNIAKARRVLASMSRRIMTNKLIMWGICLLLVGSICLVLYYKIIN